MGFVDAIKSGFSNYVNFSGRASRSEYWFWVLFYFSYFDRASIIDAILGIELLYPIYPWRMFLPEHWRFRSALARH